MSKSNKTLKIIFVILIVGTVLAALKMIFVDYTLDEEYQLVMAYRSLSGDSLFGQMWEPHQTSAFLCAFFIWIYRAATGTTTGVLIFIRVLTTLIQLGLAFLVENEFEHIISKDYAILLGILYFNISPKLIEIPEFGNMQLWFLTGIILLFSVYKRTAKRIYMIPMAVCMALEVLSYPTTLILFPVIFIYLIITEKKEGLKSALIFTSGCVICGIGYLVIILQRVGIEELLTNIRNILSSDSTHEIDGSTSSKLAEYRENFALWGKAAIPVIIISLLTVVITYLVLKYKKKIVLQKKQMLLIFSSAMACVGIAEQFYFWIAGKGYDYAEIHILMLWISAFICINFVAGETRSQLRFGIIMTIAAYIAVIYTSDLPASYQLPHGVYGILCCLTIMVYAWRNLFPQKYGEYFARILVLAFSFLCLFGKGYTLRGHYADNNTVIQIGGIMKNGPCAGILSDYIWAYIYNCDYEDYNTYVTNGSNVLIVVENLQSAGTTGYMYENNLGISHFSIVDPTTYDEKLLYYWEEYPEKKPDVIIVDCWYGELKLDENSWIMKYIENEFGYTSVFDGRYKRYYVR